MAVEQGTGKRIGAAGMWPASQMLLAAGILTGLNFHVQRRLQEGRNSENKKRQWWQ